MRRDVLVDDRIVLGNTTCVDGRKRSRGVCAHLACADPYRHGLGSKCSFEAEYAWLDVPAKRKDQGGTGRRRVEVRRTNDGGKVYSSNIE